MANGAPDGSVEVVVNVDLSQLEQQLPQGEAKTRAAAQAMQTAMDTVQRSFTAAGVASAKATDQYTQMASRVTALQQQINASVGMHSTDIAKRAADIAAYGNELDRLRAKFNPIFGVSKQYEAELLEINRAQKAGAITTQESARAVELLNTRYTLAAQSTTHLANEHRGLSAQGQAAFHSLRSMTEQLILGAPPTMILAAQMNHLSFAASHKDGLAGAMTEAASGIKGMVDAAKAAGGSLLAALFSPLGQVAIAAGLAATAVGAIFIHEHIKAKEAEEALKRHIELIGRIKDAWDNAKGAVEKYGTESIKLLMAIEVEQQKTIREQLNRDALNPTGMVSQYGATIAGLGVPQQVVDAARELRKEAAAGAADWRKYGEALAAALKDPSLTSRQQDIIRGLLDEAAAHAKIQAELQKTKETLRELSEADDQRQSFLRERTQGAGDVGRASDAYRTAIQAATASYQAQLLAIQAISHEEQIAAARAQSRAQAMQDGVVTAQELLEIERAGNIVEAQFVAERRRLLDDTLFERSQKARLSGERAVAEAMRQLWKEDYPQYMHSAEAEAVRYNEQLDKTIAKMDAIRGTTQDTIKTLIGGLQSGDFETALQSALTSIQGRVTDSFSTMLTNKLLGEKGQAGGGGLGGFLTQVIGGASGAARGSTPVSPLFVSVVGALGGAVPGGGIGDIVGDIFTGRTGGGGGGRAAILDIIARAEGTGSNYNETLARGLLTGGKQNLTGMTLDQIDTLQSSMLQNPANKWNSSALGRYQITQRTLRGLRGEMGLDGSEMYDPPMQDMLAGRLLNRRGPNAAGLRSEWAGLSGGDASQIATMMKASGEKITGSLNQLGTGMQQSVAGFAPQFGGSLQDLLKVFNSQGGQGNFGGWLNGIFGAGSFYSGAPLVGAGLFHSGGIAGQSAGAVRYVHPAHFENAPRYHGGGFAGDEVPAILQRGERILPRGASSGGGGTQVNIHPVIENNNGSKVRHKVVDDGRGTIRMTVTIDEQVEQALKAPRTARTLRDRYGAGQRLEQ